ncbi:MAG TPA: protein kinase [Pirellulales bacterium]|nr:protein kinase [Pirellulales bacterium]
MQTEREKIDEVADEFEAAWKTGTRPSLVPFLSGSAGAPRRALLVELVKIDLEYRWRIGEEPRPDDYLGEFPDLAEADGTFADELVLFARQVRTHRIGDADATVSVDRVRPSTSGFDKGGGEGAGILTDSDTPDARILANSATPGILANSATGLRCPHCHEGVNLPKNASHHAVCDHCGGSFHVAEEPDNAPGHERLPRTLGKFQLIERLGSGGFGTVYKARDAELNRLVAVKVPHTGAFASDKDRARFVREAGFAARLEHANIVKVHEIAHEGPLAFIVSGYIEGQTLAAAVGARRPSVREAATLVEQIARAVDYAHGKGVIHCDLKPSNILVDGAGRPHVADFGLARLSHPGVVVTLDGQAVGTPAYMPPEQAAGELSRVDFRSDVYSLGVVLYELLTGERPFRGELQMVLKQVLEDGPRPPRKLNDRVPRDLETICLKTMAKPQAARYATASALAADLKCFLDGEPIRARPVGHTERLWRWSRRKPLVAGLAASVAVLLMALVAGLGVEVETERKLLDLLHRNLEAGQGIALLEARNSNGLIDLVKACRTVADAPALFASRARIWSGWHAELAGRLDLLISHDDTIGKHGLRWAAFAPGDRWVVTTSSDSTARLWDARTGMPHGGRFAHEREERHIAFTADGRFFVTQGDMKTLRLWSTELAQPHGQPFTAPDNILRHALSPDGAWLAAFSHGTLRVWNTDDAKLIEQPHPEPGNVLAMAFSPDSKSLATASQNGAVELWDAATLAPGPAFAGHKGAVRVLAFSPDGRVLATGSHYDHTVRIWNVATGEALTPPLEHGENLHGVVFSPDGSLLATACFDNQARIWQVDDGRLLHRERHDGPVLAVAFSPNGRWMASASMDGTARIWDVTSAEPRGWPVRHQRAIVSVAFSADSKRLVTASDDGTARVWSVVHRDDRVLEHDDRVWQVAINPAGTLLAAGAENGRLRLWDTRTSERRGEEKLTHPGKAVEGLELLGVAFSSDGKRLATVGGPFVQLWDTATLQPRGDPFEDPGSRVVAFTPDSKLLVSGGGSQNDGGGTIHFWNIARRQRDGDSLESQEEPIHYMAISGDGKWLAAASEQRRGVRIWDVARRRLHKFILREESHALVAALEFAPGGTTLAVATRDGVVRLWDAAKGEPSEPGEPLWQRAVQVNAIAFNQDGTLLALASSDGAAQVFDTDSKLACGPPSRHGATCMSVALSRDGEWLASGSFDKTVRLRRLARSATSLDEIERLTAISLGARVDENGSVHALSGSEWRALRAAGEEHD